MGIFDKLFGGKDLQLRQPRFAGLMYPEDADALRAEVERLIEANDAGGPAPRALIVPHGDYAFAAPVMAAGYARAHAIRDSIDRVVLVGSSRLVPFRGLAVTGYDGFATPLGAVEADAEAVQQLFQRESVRAIEAAFDPEASLEVQLPFIQVALGDVEVVPLLVGDASEEDVAAALGEVWQEDSTLVVISANLSHEQPPEHGAELDAQTVRAIESLEPDTIELEHSNERIAIRGLLRAAGERGLGAETLERRSSAEVTGADEGLVTGYGTFGFSAS